RYSHQHVPQPSSGYVTIQGHGAGTLRLTNAAGQVIREETLQPGVHRLDLSQEPAGLYVLGVHSENKVTTQLLLIE
ncbi:MAG: T9SS type A sorting domain-containing protein, partial [Cytophagales bacterium]|nr:T9SS type A sorting domain-containing protein [Cytophagales bacterium]